MPNSASWMQLNSIHIVLVSTMFPILKFGHVLTVSYSVFHFITEEIITLVCTIVGMRVNYNFKSFICKTFIYNFVGLNFVKWLEEDRWFSLCALVSSTNIVSERVSDCCLMPTQQFFSYIMEENKLIFNENLAGF